MVTEAAIPHIEAGGPALPGFSAQWKNLLTAGVPASRLYREVFGPEMLDYLD